MSVARFEVEKVDGSSDSGLCRLSGRRRMDVSKCVEANMTQSGDSKTRRSNKKIVTSRVLTATMLGMQAKVKDYLRKEVVGVAGHPTPKLGSLTDLELTIDPNRGLCGQRGRPQFHQFGDPRDLNWWGRGTPVARQPSSWGRRSDLSQSTTPIGRSIVDEGVSEPPL
ncbi:hypothetical protein CRG98_043335 [Punica granatum]|uniref:Uncharacterized protein n=1 Tax=Punica granatum TaxID=22663 RepID=A0A2I0HX68_PUNGR|nr:hypothetical protein CRG98_043335 [Punica granatum]